MTTHQRLQKTMRSPVRQHRRNKQHKVNRRLAIAAEGFMTDAPGGALMRIRTVKNLLDQRAPAKQKDRSQYR